MQDLVDAYSQLERELTIARSDHLDQLNSRRLWQDKAQIAEARLKDSQESTVCFDKPDPTSSRLPTDSLPRPLMAFFYVLLTEMVTS